MNNIKITVICFRVSVVSVCHTVLTWEMSEWLRFHQKLLGRSWVWSHTHLLTPYITWSWNLNFINFLWNYSLYRNGCITYKLHFLQTFFRKMYREIHLLLVLCYSGCWKWRPPICRQILHWYNNNKFCDTCWSSLSELCRVQISIFKASRAGSLFLINVSLDSNHIYLELACELIFWLTLIYDCELSIYRYSFS
jgi:hypothetical protein